MDLGHAKNVLIISNGVRINTKWDTMGGKSSVQLGFDIEHTALNIIQ
jgi:hypothetical protein